MDRKTSVSVAISLGQLERLARVTERARISRSLIVRDGLERELERYEKQLGIANGTDVDGLGVGRRKAARKKTRRRP